MEKVLTMNSDPSSDATDEVRVAISSPESWLLVSWAMVMEGHRADLMSGEYC